MCAKRRKRDVTGELSVSYMGVGIMGEAGMAMAPHFLVIVMYQSLYNFCRLTFVCIGVTGCPLHFNIYFLLSV